MHDDNDPGSSGIRLRTPMLLKIYQELRLRSNNTFEIRAYQTNVLQTRKSVPGLHRPTRAPAQAIGYVMYLPGNAMGTRTMFAECVVVEPQDAMIALTWLLQHGIVECGHRELRRTSLGITTEIKPVRNY